MINPAGTDIFIKLWVVGKTRFYNARKNVSYNAGWYSLIQPTNRKWIKCGVAFCFFCDGAYSKAYARNSNTKTVWQITNLYFYSCFTALNGCGFHLGATSFCYYIPKTKENILPILQSYQESKIVPLISPKKHEIISLSNKQGKRWTGKGELHHEDTRFEKKVELCFHYEIRYKNLEAQAVLSDGTACNYLCGYFLLWSNVWSADSL